MRKLLFFLIAVVFLPIGVYAGSGGSPSCGNSNRIQAVKDFYDNYEWVGCGCKSDPDWVARVLDKGGSVLGKFPNRFKCGDKAPWWTSEVATCSGFEKVPDEGTYDLIPDHVNLCWRWSCKMGYLLTAGNACLTDALFTDPTKMAEECAKRNPEQCATTKAKEKFHCMLYKDTCILKCDIQNPDECGSGTSNNPKKCIIYNGRCMPPCEDSRASEAGRHNTFIEIKFSL